ncbi:hypothetical protein AB0F30_33185 [Streptomyces sp. NPDC029006]|uniref:hypothetical protein n=1 Tax=Streptomyces sp. NPDC029006 TaxID=3155467 RepID=UPI00340A04C9
MMATDTRRPLIDVPPDLLPLIPLPDLEALPDARARGAHCVWGGELLSTATAVDLGERPSPHGTTLFLRGCRQCSLRAVLTAYNTHPRRCEQCADESAICKTLRGLRALALELRK